MNNPRNLALAGASAITLLYFLPINPFNTLATRNIGDAWSRGGGSKTHTPAISTPRGYKDSTESNQIDPTGIDTQHFKDNHASQKNATTTPIGKAMNEAHHGVEHSK